MGLGNIENGINNGHTNNSLNLFGILLGKMLSRYNFTIKVD